MFAAKIAATYLGDVSREVAHVETFTRVALDLPDPVCVNSFETTWLRKLVSTHNGDGEAALQSERSPRTTHEFIAFWNSVAGMVRVRAGRKTLP